MVKVSIIGATGRLGAFSAHTLSHIPYVDELMLIGRPSREEFLDGLVRDLSESFAARGDATDISWSTDLEDVERSMVIVSTAGIPRQSGQDRLDLAMQNARIVAPMAEQIGEIAPNAILFIVTNPVDVMTAVALRYSHLNPERVFGLGTHLDSMRLKSLIAEKLHVHVSEVHTRIIGEHGESMVPLWSATTIGGIRINNLPAYSRLNLDRMVETVKTSGEMIIKKKGSTVYGPGEAIATLVRTVLGNENRILTVSSYIRSEVHDIRDVCIGVPARVNRSGVFPVPIRLEEEEIIAFRESAEKMRIFTREVMEKLKQ
jgi:malate dehydrogenase